jgi:hypothetical protein
MIFQHTLDAVLAGRKTQTRRVMKWNEVLNGDPANTEGDAVTYHADDGNPHPSAWRVKWQVGKTYAVQPARGKPSIARIEITRIDAEWQGVAGISDEQAKTEGFTSRDEFLVTWEAIHGANMLTVPVWVLTFKLGENTLLDRVQKDYPELLEGYSPIVPTSAGVLWDLVNMGFLTPQVEGANWDTVWNSFTPTDKWDTLVSAWEATKA